MKFNMSREAGSTFGGKKIGVFFALSFFWPILVLAENQLFISQVQTTGGTGKTTEDFIELFNPLDNQVNLNGFRLVKRTENGTSDTSIKSWTADTYIPARSFYLWANSNFSNISMVPDITTSATLSDNNGIALRFGENDIGTIIDSISWGSANNGFVNLSTENLGANTALFRQNLYQPNSNFTIASSSPRNSSIQESVPPVASSTPDSTASSTPGISSSTPEYLIQSSYVKIYRFLPNPAGDDGGKEWVELQNLDEKNVLLDGWLIDDKDIGNGPGTDALELSGIILTGEIKKFVIPENSFALNNSGGDEVNLYFSDKILAHKVVYSAAAYDDGIFEYRGGEWQPPAQSFGGGLSGGSSNSGSSNNQSNTSNMPIIQFKFNEIFPNPVGEDAGKEWVEIYNPENATSSLEGYFLADGESDSWSSSAWAIPKDKLVPPKGLLAIMLPKDTFALNNTGKEKIKLFSPQKQVIDSISFKDALENKSLIKNADGDWEWGIPSFGFINGSEPEVPKIYISEVLPQPFGDSEEFVEIGNFATSTISLAGVVLQIGSRSKTFGENDIVRAGGYLVIYEDNLPARLSNSGQTLKLLDSFGRIISETTYSKALVGHSWASVDKKKFSWTGSFSPGKENEMVLGEAVITPVEENDKAKTSEKKSSATASSGDMKKLLQSNQNLEDQIFSLQESVDLMSQKLAILDANPNQPKQAEPEVANFPNNRFLSFAVGALILSTFIFIVLKFVKL